MTYLVNVLLLLTYLISNCVASCNSNDECESSQCINDNGCGSKKNYKRGCRWDASTNTCFGVCDYKSGAIAYSKVFVTVSTRLQKTGSVSNFNTFQRLPLGTTATVHCANGPDLKYNCSYQNSKYGISPTWIPTGSDVCLSGCSALVTGEFTNTISYKSSAGLNAEGSTFLEGTVATLDCLEGCYHDHISPTCNANGQWYPDADCQPLAGCPVPPITNSLPQSGSPTPIPGTPSLYTDGSTITFDCKPGFYDKSTRTSTTTSTCVDGEWDPDLVDCIVGCADLSTNATMSGSTPILFVNPIYIQTSVVSFACNDGSYLNDTVRSAMCQTDGQWNATFPSCFSGCKLDTILTNAHKTGETSKLHNDLYEQTAVVNFTCAFGFYLDPPVFTTVCNQSGNWNFNSTSTPQCKLGCQDFSMANVDVSYPVSGETYNQLYTVGSQINVSCQQGYAFIERVVSKPSTCNGNGIWSEVQICHRVCGSAPWVDHTQSIKYIQADKSEDANNQTYFDDTIATYTCAYPNTIGSDYAAFPSCKNGSWSAPLPICNFGLFITKTAMTMSCSILIASLVFMIIATLWIRDFSLESVIHLNEEISLLLAHLVLLLARERVDLGTICNVAGIALQYFFSVNFLFMVFEALQNLSMLQNIISFGGFCVEPRFHNTIVGWVAPLIPTGLTISIFYTDYPSPFSCWVNLTRDSLIGTAIMAPMLICAFLTVILTEAAVMGDIRPMPLTDRNQLIAAHVNQKALFPFVFLNSLSCFVGMVGAYRLDLYLFSIVSASNTTLAVCFIVFHFAGNPKLINWFRSKVVKKIKAKWHRRS